MVRHWGSRGAFAASIFSGVVVACSSYGTNDAQAPSSSADAGSEDAATRGDATDASFSSCEAGSCPATRLATSTEAITWLVVDATRVIWMTGEGQGESPGDVYACPKSGCPQDGPTKLFHVETAAFLASNGETVFVSEAFGANEGVWRVEGNGRSKVSALGAMKGAFWMVERSDALYVSEDVVADAGPYYRAVHRVGLPALDVDVLVGAYSPDDSTNTLALAVSATRVYLGSHSTPNVVSCAVSSCTFASFASGNAYGISLATDDTRVFWVALDKLWGCLEGAACLAPEALVDSTSDANRPLAVIHHAGSLFVEMSGGDLLECRSSACASTKRTIAREPGFPAGIGGTMFGDSFAADSDALYYVARDGTNDASFTYRVMRLPRSPI